MCELLGADGVHGNPSSMSHSYGHQARAVVEAARAQVAHQTAARPDSIVFTSGATESNNIALFGAARAHRSKGNHIVSSRTEHKAVLDPLKRLEREGFEVTYLKPDVSGIVHPEQVVEALRPETVLVSLMHANNETGVLQDVGTVGRTCRVRDVIFHVDAAQSYGKAPVNVEAMCIDLLSMTAHKIYGPKGVGALYVAKRNPAIELAPLIDGGGHERGYRSGTLNVPAIVGFGKAAELCRDTIDSEAPRLGVLRDRLWERLSKRIEGVHLNGPVQPRLANNLNVRIDAVHGESLLKAIGGDLAVSSGAACATASAEPSHVLRAIGLTDEQARSTLRFGLGRFSTEQEIDTAVTIVADAARHLRRRC